MLRRTRHLRPAVETVTSKSPVSSSSSSSNSKNNSTKRAGLFSFITRARVAAAMAVMSAPVGYYYTQVHLPRARHIAALLQQKRPQRTTPVFTTGNEPISSLTTLIQNQNGGAPLSIFSNLVFYINSIFRLTQFFFRSTHIFYLMLKFAIGQYFASSKIVSSSSTTSSAESKNNNNDTGRKPDDIHHVPDPILLQIGEELTAVFADMGGSYVKLGQWCATRSDVFPREVCDSLELLYDKAHPHSWEDTKKMLKDANLLDAFEEIDEIPVSSGTIAQVHKAKLKVGVLLRDKDLVNVLAQSSATSRIDDADDGELLGMSKQKVNNNNNNLTSSSSSSSSTVNNQDNDSNPQQQQQNQTSIAVAVKVMHPRIRNIILEDMQALRWATQLFNMIIPSGSYLGLTQAVEEFTALLYSQLDMVREAENLNEFRFNFRLSDRTVFPRPFLSLTTPDVLVETFEYGIALNSKYVDALTGVADGTDDIAQRKKNNTEPSSAERRHLNNKAADLSLMDQMKAKSSASAASKRRTIQPNDFSDLGNLAVEMFLKMVFEDNLIHSDLHPGNILVRIHNQDGSYSLKRRGPLSHSQLVVLDPGLVTSMSDRERENFIALFTCVATGDGDLGAKLMLERAPDQQCEDVQSFTSDMKKVFDRVTPRNLTFQEVDLAGIMREVLETMRQHRVRIDMNFASLVATVALGEGLGRRLVRDFNLFEASMPFLLHCLKSHELHYMISKLHEMYLVDGMNMK